MLRPVLVTQFAFNTAFFMLLATFVPHAVGNLGLSATGTGLTLAIVWRWMVVGVLYAPRLLRQLAFGTIVALGPFAGPSPVLVSSCLVPDRSCGSSAQRRCDKP